MESDVLRETNSRIAITAADTFRSHMEGIRLNLKMLGNDPLGDVLLFLKEIAQPHRMGEIGNPLPFPDRFPLVIAELNVHDDFSCSGQIDSSCNPASEGILFVVTVFHSKTGES